ncbi:coiled-coil domain-containing protein 69 [Nannospalax galili]|uniref:Coiled-coil domain containing 69 n=1 Tax=Nannospalax galili TaxID=1026970 RepID=A0A8C6QIS5_NANGA|nr:coiled-coil domain-containing protein 69 [Nannospalax galili]
MGCRHSRSAEKVEKRETELLDTLDKEQRILEGRQEEAGPVLQTSYEQEKDALTNSFQETKALLQDTSAKLCASQEAVWARMNGVQGYLLSRVYNRHIQDHGSPGLFWEQELESLHHVIELKNERIHELERELLLVDMLKEKNLMLALKNTTLRQEIEDLHFRAGNRATMSRQFWKDVLQVLEKGSQDGPLCSRRRSH